MNSKPFLPIKGQIAHLKTMGVFIGNKRKAKAILQSINFQRLLAYRFKFIKNSSIIPGTKLNHIYKLHKFDKELRDITRGILESIELELRRHIAYTLGKKNLHEYLKNSNFNCCYKHAHFLTKINSYKNSNNKHCLVKNHIDKYTYEIPIYKIVEFLTFWDLSKFLENLNDNYKEEICIYYYKVGKILNYNKRKTYIVSWIRDLVEIRNICAHNDILWSFHKKIIKMKSSKAKEWDRGLQKNGEYKFYVVCLILKYLASEKDFNKYLSDLIILVNKYSTIISLDDLGFPKSWKQDLNKKFK